MSLHKDWDSQEFNLNDLSYEKEDGESLSHRKKIRRLLEDRLEKKRLKHELEDELDGDFDWDELDR